MSDLLTHPLMMRGLWATSMAKALLRFRNPRRREAGKHHAAFYRRTWRDAAETIGATWQEVSPDVLEISLRDERTRVIDSVSAIDDPVTLAILHDKPLMHRLLSELGLPVPAHVIFSLGDIAAAVRFLEAIDAHCVVKPASGTGGGRGVTTGIRTRWQLARAAAAAAVYDDQLIIERQFAGDNYRLLFLDGQLLDAFVRQRPTVTGDGQSTVRALVDAHNDHRLQNGADVSQVLLTIDMDMRRTLARQGLSLRSVPAAGREVTLKTVVNENSGADNTTVTDRLSPSIIDDCTRAIRALRVRFAGVDLITPDPTRPLAESGGVILEVNGTPNLYFHYHKRDGAFPVAVHLLRRLLQADTINDRRNLAVQEQHAEVLL